MFFANQFKPQHCQKHILLGSSTFETYQILVKMVETYIDTIKIRRDVIHEIYNLFQNYLIFCLVQLLRKFHKMLNFTLNFKCFLSYLYFTPSPLFTFTPPPFYLPPPLYFIPSSSLLLHPPPSLPLPVYKPPPPRLHSPASLPHLPFAPYPLYTLIVEYGGGYLLADFGEGVND